MFTIVVLLFAGVILALVLGALALLSESRARRDPTDARYRTPRRLWPGA